MPKNRRFLRRAAALILAVLLLAAAMPSALAADTRTGTVSAPTGILLLLTSPGGEAAGEVPDGSAVSILSEEPGIYLPGKLGVRIEDVVILTENGCQDITLSPKNLIIL